MHLRHISPGSTDWLDAVSDGGDDGGGRGGGKPQGPDERPKVHALHAARSGGDADRPNDRRRASPTGGPGSDVT
jgi:hypothetical protein